MGAKLTFKARLTGFLETLEEIVIEEHGDSERPTDAQTDTQTDTQTHTDTQRQPGPTHTIVKMGGAARLKAFKEGEGREALALAAAQEEEEEVELVGDGEHGEEEADCRTHAD
jgi:hypothetical protein